MQPMRTKVVLDVIIASPTRIEAIRLALKKFTISSADAAAAKVELGVLKPTKAELAAALGP
jgi:hypothetical protein